METSKKLFLILGLALTCGAYGSMAQIIVTVRPHRPHIQRSQPPGPHHVWIEEDWAPRGNTYEFRGGRWEEPPQNNAIWVPGHWKDTRGGSVWVPGQWRTNQGNRGRGHGNRGRGH
jgi:hypothetical protein